MIRISIFFLLFSASFAASAESIFVCDLNCSNTERQAQAVSMMYNDGDKLSIFDTKSGIATTYIANKEFTLYGELIEGVTLTQTSQHANSIANTYNQMIELFKTKPITLPTTIESLPSESASRIMTEGQLESRIGNYLRNNASTLEILQARADNLLSIAINRLTNATIENTILLQFDDLSTAYFTINMNLANGDSIPSSADNLLGNWVFENESDSRGFASWYYVWI